MAKKEFLYKFPETDEQGFEFPEKHESGFNFGTRFRRVAFVIVLLVGVALVIFGTLFLIKKSSGDKTLQDLTYNISDRKLLQSDVLSVPEIGDGNKTSNGSITALKRPLQTLTELENATSTLSDNSRREDYVPSNPDIISSEESISFENFFRFDTNTDTADDTSIVSNRQGPTINVNKDCEKSPFDKAFVEILTQDQRNAVERLMEKVASNLMETFCDANSESYLVRWLKCKDWNVAEAAKALFHTLAWRKKEEIDKLETEDFSYFDEAFPVFMDGKDYDGRIVISMDTAHVDTRKIFLAGKGDQMLRYLTRMFERGLNLSREAQFRGENVTQGIMINNLQGFSMKQHACDKCIAFMFRFLTVLEEHYPSSFYKFFVINTPHEFEWVLHLAKAVLPSYIVDAIEIFGTNKQEWQKTILELVPANQIRPQFGGTKTDDDY